MHFDERHARERHRVAQRHTGMREAGGIQQHEVSTIAASFRVLHELALGIGLKRAQRMARALRLRDETIDDVGQRGRAINSRLARTERIEIRTIHYQHVCHQFATVRRNIPAKGPHCGRTKRLCTTPNVGEKTHRVWEFGSEINACSGDFPPSMMAATCPPNADALTGKR